MSHKIAFVGNFFKDNFYICLNNKFSHYSSYGGINRIDNQVVFPPNLFQRDRQHISEYVCNLCVNDFGESSSVRLIKRGDTTYIEPQLITEDRDWIHFAYVNNMFDLDVSKFRGNIKSCDISTYSRNDIPKEQIMENIFKCDYVFMSGNSPIHWGEILRNPYGRKQVIILHEKYGSFALDENGRDIGRCGNNIRDFKLTTGAGDMFAAYFMRERVQGEDLERCLRVAHEETSKWLEKINEEV